jgi:twitching motility protein PilT
MIINKLLDQAQAKNITDLHLTDDRPAMIRQSGQLRIVEEEIISREQLKTLLEEIAPPRNLNEINENGSSDFACNYKELRLRISVFRQQGTLALAIRLLPDNFLSWDELDLPVQLQRVITRKHGLFLVCGPTGSGKTTTMAGLLNHINNSSAKHIITIEDPVEFIYPQGKSLIHQRQVGDDVISFQTGLTKALRQDPDVILIGEMRDLATTRTAITAAETGHLVFATMHARNVGSAITRLISQFPRDEQMFVRAQTAESLLAIIAQRLLPRADGQGLTAAMEIMLMTDSIASLIRQEKEAMIPDEILKGKLQGMQFFDDHLERLVENGTIKKGDAVKYADTPGKMKTELDQGTKTDKKTSFWLK